MVRYGLIGWPICHSFSPEYFEKKFNEMGIEGEYKLYPIPNIADLPGLLRETKDLDGLNVTHPYKEQVLPYLHKISEDALEIGAVNVIKIKYDEHESLKLEGYNSDWQAFQTSIRPLLNPHIKSSLVLGTGGASRAVCHALQKEGIRVLKVSRTAKGSKTINYEALTKNIIEENKLIVNATPLGMYPDIMTAPQLPYEYLTAEHICYDLVYNPELTEFMKLSAKMGATVKNGLEMLHLQADISYEIWNNIRHNVMERRDPE